MRVHLFLVSVVLILSGCSAPMPGDNVADQSRPMMPIAPIPQMETNGGGEAAEAVEPVQERHGVVTRQDCLDMAERFRRQGRQVELVDTRPSENPGATLKYTCIFEGDDAEEGWFEDVRF